jgi:hypothetical protein
METIPNHVESRAKTRSEKWKQVMDDCKELTCLTNIADYTMASIIYRTIENEQTKYYVQEAHLGVDKLFLWVAILKTRHLVEKLSKQPHVDKFTHY